MKIGLVGAGRFGKNHVRTLHEMGVLAGVAELDAAELFAQRRGHDVALQAVAREALLHQAGRQHQLAALGCPHSPH